MKICGCEDAEKGYVIINPDSPDRRQILSLNPPICREIISNTLEIDGEIHIFKKEIEDWTITPLPSGIKVDWGGGDVEILSGVTSTESRRLTYSGYLMVNGNRSNFSGVAPEGATTVVGAIASFGRNTWTFSNCSKNTVRAVSVPHLIFDSPDTSLRDDVAQCVLDNPNNQTLYRNHIRVLGTSQYATYSTPVVEEINSVIKIITNTEDFSERQTSISPDVSLLAGICELQVDFVDNSQSPLIEFPQCPQNIKKIESLEISDMGGILEQIAPAPSGEIVISCGERECPPETCFNCDCSELNCCYDENGKLIDSFTRRT